MMSASKAKKRIEAKVASSGAGEIGIFLDHPQKGKQIGSLKVPDTSGLQNWKTVKASVRKSTGTHRVFLSSKGKLQLIRFNLKDKPANKKFLKPCSLILHGFYRFSAILALYNLGMIY